MRTEEQQRHLKTLETRIRELEQLLFRQVANIARHLQSALDGGMEEYRTFVVDGQILIEPNLPVILREVEDRFVHLYPYSVVTINEGRIEDNLRFYKEVADQYDWHYVQHPEEYPTDYVPVCRAYDKRIEDGLISELFTIEDLMLIKPEDIYSHIEIYI